MFMPNALTQKIISVRTGPGLKFVLLGLLAHGVVTGLVKQWNKGPSSKFHASSKITYRKYIPNYKTYLFKQIKISQVVSNFIPLFASYNIISNNK